MRQYLQCFMLSIGILLPISNHAQLSPGPLASPHSHLSGLTNCLSCHTWGSKNLSPKCEACHTPIKTRVEKKLGYHGQLQETTCAVCHSDHLGSEFQMIHWDPSQEDFDHKQSGYQLSGKHLELDCRDCHIENFLTKTDVFAYSDSIGDRGMLSKTFLGLDPECVACHPDVHRGEFENVKCEECHDVTSWKNARDDFDHDSRTKYPLQGAHTILDCDKCHSEKQESAGKYQVPVFTGLEFQTCTECHEDKHEGAFGSNCLNCHSETTFEIDGNAEVLNHNVSRFPLIGAHAQTACEGCHTSDGQFTNIESFNDCLDCHTDYHQGAFANGNGEAACDNCHSVYRFLPALFGVNEHEQTTFPLDGAHLAQPCVFCHQEAGIPVYTWESTMCLNCHETTHGQQFQDYRQDDNWCENCHKTSAWSDLSFKHGDTNFPLTGKHDELTCVHCHKEHDRVIQYEISEKACSDCHSDVHADQFQPKNCEYCHTTNYWNIPKFDHLNLTQYPLDGHHIQLKCGECHKYAADIETIRFKPLGSRCQDCHSFQDYK